MDHLEVKFAGSDLMPDESGAIEGYASVFGAVDKGGDVVAKGAYRKSLAAMKSSGLRVKMLWQHDPERPIGVWDEIVEDDRGLIVKGRILPEIDKGREAIALVKAGAIDGLSIGYRTIAAAKDADGNRVLKEVELWEVSLVTFPMLPSATITSVKADADILEKLKAGDRLTEREFENMVKGLGLSNSQAERAARVHLKGPGEPVEAAKDGAAFLRALLGQSA